MPEQLVSADPGWQSGAGETPRIALLAGRQAAASNGQPEEPSSIAHWFETELRPMLERVAKPQTISDIASLLIPDAPGGIAGAVHEAGRLATNAKDTVAGPANALWEAFTRKFGMNTDAIDLATTQKRLQAARSATRTARGYASMAEGATSPAETAPAAAAPAPPPATAPAPPAASPVLQVMGHLRQSGLSEAEARAFAPNVVKWLQEGVPLETIQQRIETTRALQQAGPFANLPTDLDVAKAVDLKNTESAATRAARAARTQTTEP